MMRKGGKVVLAVAVWTCIWGTETAGAAKAVAAETEVAEVVSEDAAPAVSDVAAVPVGVETAEADSCAAAFATAMARGLAPEVDRKLPLGPEARRAFCKGMEAALTAVDTDPSYAVGMSYGLGMAERMQTMRDMGFPLTPQAFCRYLAQILTGEPNAALGFEPATADRYLQEFLRSHTPAVEPLSTASQEAFIQEKKKGEGAIVTPSGLIFEVLTEGEGQHPTDTDRVKLTYTGSLADGTVFDTAEQPVVFAVSNLVPGFTEGLKMMKPGGSYRLFIPPALGYGDDGAGGGVIPPNAALQFEVNLIDIIH